MNDIKEVDWIIESKFNGWVWSFFFFFKLGQWTLQLNLFYAFLICILWIMLVLLVWIMLIL